MHGSQQVVHRSWHGSRVKKDQALSLHFVCGGQRSGVQLMEREGPVFEAKREGGSRRGKRSVIIIHTSTCIT